MSGFMVAEDRAQMAAAVPHRRHCAAAAAAATAAAAVDKAGVTFLVILAARADKAARAQMAMQAL
jgi:hypothetical protein